MNYNAFLMNSKDCLLVIIDLQTRLTAVMPEPSANLMINNIAKLLQAAKHESVPVLLTEQYPEKLGSTIAEVALHLPTSSQTFAKLSFSCCQVDDFIKALELSGKRQVILCGQEAHICVLQTAIELLQANYQVFVVSDAVCSRQTEHKLNALQRLQSLGVIIVNYESVLFEWLRTADHVNFKAISSLSR